MSEVPKKPQRKTTKSKKLIINKRKSWTELVDGVDKNQVPTEILNNILVTLVDGTTININVKELIKQGESPSDIEEMLDIKFTELDEYIENVDFFVDVDSVEGAVQPETDKALKGL